MKIVDSIIIFEDILEFGKEEIKLKKGEWFIFKDSINLNITNTKIRVWWVEKHIGENGCHGLFLKEELALEYIKMKKDKENE